MTKRELAAIGRKTGMWDGKAGIEAEIAGVRWMLRAIKDWRRGYKRTIFRPLTAVEDKAANLALGEAGIVRDRISADNGRLLLLSLATLAQQRIDHLENTLK